MSDPVTNVEIEDVLSSIRRLVSDGDKARTRDPAPVDVQPDVHPQEQVDVPEEDAPEEVADAKPEKLVLTPAFMVPQEADTAEPPAQDDVQDFAEPEEADAEPQDEEGDLHDAEVHDAEVHDEPHEAEDEDNSAEFDAVEDDAPLALTEMVWDDAEDQTSDTAKVETPDRSNLVATIAELEAAVAGGAQDFEPDGSETMGQTIAWPGRVSKDVDDVEDAEEVHDEEAATPEAGAEVEADGAAEAPLDLDADARVHDTADAEPQASVEENEDPIPTFAHRGFDTPESAEPQPEDTPASEVYDDDDLDSILEAGGVQLDEAALRALVAEVVREELSGPMGERITRNVRKLVRREIYRILSSQEFD